MRSAYTQIGNWKPSNSNRRWRDALRRAACILCSAPRGQIAVGTQSKCFTPRGRQTDCGLPACLTTLAPGAQSLAGAALLLQCDARRARSRLDRLARSVRDLLNILERFGQDDIGFVSLREKHIDITSAGGRLVLNIMASIAEFERELIAARMAEGRQRAMDNGVKFGPPFKLDAFQKREALARIKAGESQSLIARTYGVDRATISRLQKRAAAS